MKTLIRKPGLICIALGTLLAASCGGSGDSNGDGDGDSDGPGGSNAGDGDSGGDGDSAPAAFCKSDKDCRDSDGICDTARSVCVECLSDTECSEGARCISSACVEVTPCDSSKDCSADEVCSDSLGICVECEGDNDCEGDSVCVANTCSTSCSSDKDCSASDQVCSTAQQICVDCDSDADCADDQHCEANACVADICEAEPGSCDGDDLVLCDARGAGFATTTCPDGCTSGACGDGECSEGEEACACYPNDTCNEGLDCLSGFCVDTSGGGNNGNCAGNTANHCSSIPKFVGTQTVDGNGEEFCNIPAQVLTYANAEYQNLEGYGGDTSVIEATFRVAWDDDAIRAHVHVKDPSVLHSEGQWYDGDSVQFYFAAVTPTTGPPDYDNGAVQIGVPIGDTIPGLYAGDPGGLVDHAYRLVDDGYEVEVEWTWGTTEFLSPPVPGAGDTIAFNLMVGAQQNETLNNETPASYRDFEFGLSFIEGTYGLDEFYSDTQVWCTPTLAE